MVLLLFSCFIRKVSRYKTVRAKWMGGRQQPWAMSCEHLISKVAGKQGRGSYCNVNGTTVYLKWGISISYTLHILHFRFATLFKLAFMSWYLSTSSWSRFCPSSYSFCPYQAQLIDLKDPAVLWLPALLSTHIKTMSWVNLHLIKHTILRCSRCTHLRKMGHYFLETEREAAMPPLFSLTLSLLLQGYLSRR